MTSRSSLPRRILRLVAALVALSAMGGVAGARWQRDDQLHLTLRFIGEVDDVTASDIDGMLETLHMPGFDLSLKGVGLFGGKDPHSLWIGVAPCEGLTRLAAKIEKLACFLQSQGPIAVPPRSEPEPDSAIVRGRLEDFVGSRPGP
jgi:2'-5' RNA ligase